MSSKVTERRVLGALMHYVMEDLNHHCAVPNSGMIFRGESDLLSITRAGLLHEWEVKLSQADYRRDFRTKRNKHAYLRIDDGGRWMPCYFWFVIHGFELELDEVPLYAGLAIYDPDVADARDAITIERQAPRHAGRRVNGRDHKQIARLLSFRLKNELFGSRRRLR